MFRCPFCGVTEDFQLVDETTCIRYYPINGDTFSDNYDSILFPDQTVNVIGVRCQGCGDYFDATEENGKVICPILTPKRGYRINKRCKSVTLNVYNTEQLVKGFSSAVKTTFNYIFPYCFLIRRDGSVVFFFDSNIVPTDMRDRSKLVVKFKGEYDIWESIRDMLLWITPDKMWYQGEKLKCGVTYYVT